MLPIIDTHQHLIYTDRFEYEWTAEIPALEGISFTQKKYSDLAQTAGISQSIFMETAVADEQYQSEAGFFHSMIAEGNVLTTAIIASCRPEIEKGFDQWLDTGDSQCVGYRRILHIFPDEMSQTDTFRANVRKIGNKGKTFDMCFLESQLDIAYDLAVSCDNTTLILDHCGVPNITSGSFSQWSKSIDKLAQLANVYCKISGVVAYCGDSTQHQNIVKPYIEHCIEQFGWDRVIWGSDWPLVNIGISLPEWVSITRAIIAGDSQENQEKLLYKNAMRIYNVASPI